MTSNNIVAVAAAPPASLPSAVSRIFSTTELLEKILKAVASDISDGLRTLLLSQRTWKAFRDTINESPTLRRALYFDRDPNSLEPSPFERNPLLPSWSEFVDAQDGTKISFIFRPLPGGDVCEFMLSVRRWHSEKNALGGIQSSYRRMHFFDGAQGPVVTAVYFSGSSRKRVEGRWVNPKLDEILDLVHAEGTDF